MSHYLYNFACINFFYIFIYIFLLYTHKLVELVISLFMHEGFIPARIPQNNSLPLDIESHL